MNAVDLAKQLDDVHTQLNIVWTLLTGFLVMFMQAGFALVETGLTRAKNVAHTMAMNFLVYAIGILGFWAIGFALQMGGVGPLATFLWVGTVTFVALKAIGAMVGNRSAAADEIDGLDVSEMGAPATHPTPWEEGAPRPSSRW